MRKSQIEPSAPPPIPQALYYLGAASGLWEANFSVQPTIPNLVLDRLIRSSKGADGPASYEELLTLARTPESDSIDAATGNVNASQALRYSLRRLRRFFGEEFFGQTGEVPDSTYERLESDEALARRFTRPVMEASIEHAAKRHFLATNRPVLLEFANHLFQRYDIQDPVEQEMLRTVVLLAGLPFNFQNRNPDIMQVRVTAFKSIREKLGGLRREVVFMRDGKPRTRQRVHPIGAIHRTYFMRPEWLSEIEGFHSLEEIVAAHRQRFGHTLPLGFFGPTQMIIPFPRPAAPGPVTTRVAVSTPRFSDPQFAAANELFDGGGNGENGNGNGAHPSTKIESRRFTTPEGRSGIRRRGVRVVELPPSATSAPEPQSPELPNRF